MTLSTKRRQRHMKSVTIQSSECSPLSRHLPHHPRAHCHRISDSFTPSRRKHPPISSRTLRNSLKRGMRVLCSATKRANIGVTIGATIYKNIRNLWKTSSKLSDSHRAMGATGERLFGFATRKNGRNSQCVRAEQSQRAHSYTIMATNISGKC